MPGEEGASDHPVDRLLRSLIASPRAASAAELWQILDHKNGFVILEGVTIGICNTWGSCYFSADTVRRPHDVATGRVPAARNELIPVA